jgi:penicillin-binding protein 1C
MVGYPHSKTLLNMLGFSHIREEASYYTDSLILGGCEVTLVELAAAYRSLADGGKYVQPKWTPDTGGFSRQIISPEAAYLVSNILQDEKRLIPLYQELFQETNQFIAFKTGTSYGLRDAWCLGFTKFYTVGIWVGSPSGAGYSSLVGMQAAAPIMLKVIRALGDSGDLAFSKPSGIYTRKVCALSGALPTKNCPQVVDDLVIRGVTKKSSCSLHKNIDGRTYIEWPSELRNWMSQNDLHSVKTNNIKIIRPTTGHTVVLQKDSGVERIFLSAEGDTPHYWYMDGKFFSVSPNGEGIFADVSAGRHKVSVMSGDSSDSASFEVKTPKEIRDSIKIGRGNILN